jgi:tetratricopeptide (TPR) repeat protein
MNANPSLAQIVQEGHTAYQAGDYQAAAASFDRAAQDYAAQDNPLGCAEMANNRSVALLKAGDTRRAYQAAEGTDIVFAQAGDKTRQALALRNQAAALEAMHNYDPAMAKYEQAAALLKETGEQEALNLTLRSLSALHMRQWHVLDALVVMNSALIQKSRLSLGDRLLKWLLGIVFGLIQRR